MTDITPAELELTVLSAFHTADAVRHAVDAGICEDSFQVDAHARAWLYMLERATAGFSVQAGDVKAASGVELGEFISDDTTFVKELARVTLTRQTRAALIANVGELEQDPEETIRKLVGALNGVVKVGKGRTVYFDGDAEERYLALLAKQDALARGETIGLKTGLACFDNNLDTWQPGEVCAIIGPLNVGKSTLLFWLAAYVYFHSKKRVLILSPESNTNEVGFKLDATLAGWMDPSYEFSVRDLSHGLADREQYRAYIDQVAMEGRRDLVIKDSGSQGVFSVDDIISLTRQHEPGFLAIDGFHLISGKGDSWQKMKDAADRIKGEAQGSGMVVAVTSQVQRTALMAPDDPAEIGQSAYGLALAETADRVISMAEKRGSPMQRVFKVPKMRGAAKINFKQTLGFDVDHGRIWQPQASADFDSGEVSFD